MATPTRISAKARPKPKTLSHIEVHPAMGGGVTVKHVYPGFDHDPEEHQFGPDEKSEAIGHIVEHGGFSDALKNAGEGLYEGIKGAIESQPAALGPELMQKAASGVKQALGQE